ncbi:hypothetical protein SUDANB106_00797 [Streptomyces sp. enrichment culture]
MSGPPTPVPSTRFPEFLDFGLPEQPCPRPSGFDQMYRFGDALTDAM